MSKTITTAQFLDQLRANDKTVADWCREHGFSQTAAYRVLNNKTRGRWGETRRIAKAMNLALPEMLAGKAKRAQAAAQPA